SAHCTTHVYADNLQAGLGRLVLSCGAAVGRLRNSLVLGLCFTFPRERGAFWDCRRGTALAFCRHPQCMGCSFVSLAQQPAEFRSREKVIRSRPRCPDIHLSRPRERWTLRKRRRVRGPSPSCWITFALEKYFPAAGAALTT